MPPLLFMDTDSQSTSEDTSVRGGANPQSLEKKVGGEREKNRDAARKSRKRQIERADQLHEELQNLEHSNSALKKEIAALRSELHHYKAVLQFHKPPCRLQVSSSSLPFVAPFSAALPSLSSPSNVSLPEFYTKTNINISCISHPNSQCINASCLSNPTLSEMCTLNRSDNLPLSSPVTKLNTSNSSTCLFPSTNPPLYSYSSTGLNQKTHFVKANPLATDRASKSSHLSSPITTVVPCSGQEMLPSSSSGSADNVLQTNSATLPHTILYSGVGSTMMTKQEAVSDGSHLKNLPDPSSEYGSDGPVSLFIPPYVLHPTPCNLPFLSVPPATPLMQLDCPLATIPRQMLHFGYQNIVPGPTRMPSVPSYLPDIRMTSSDFDGFSSVTPMRDEPKDLSFSELLECNDWLLDNVSVKEDN